MSGKQETRYEGHLSMCSEEGFSFMPPSWSALVVLSQQHVLPSVSMGLNIRASLLRILVAKIGSHFGSNNFSSYQTRSSGCLHRYLQFIYGVQPLKWRQYYLSDLAPLSVEKELCDRKALEKNQNMLLHE